MCMKQLAKMMEHMLLLVENIVNISKLSIG
jgi:hypothetical protein